jgi:hypothetical protein
MHVISKTMQGRNSLTKTCIIVGTPGAGCSVENTHLMCTKPWVQSPTPKIIIIVVIVIIIIISCNNIIYNNIIIS